MSRAPLSQRRLATALLGLAVALSVHGTSPAQTAGATRPDSRAVAGGDRRALIDSGESPDLFLLYTGDVIGYLDPCG